MDQHHLHWYLEELLIHSTAALSSITTIRSLIADPTARQRRDVWAAVSSFLGNAAMISKYLDINRTTGEVCDRSAVLRSVLGIAGTAFILDRRTRNNIEHFDERIDGWVRSGKSKIIEMVFDDRAEFDYLCDDRAAVRRCLIVDELVYVSEDEAGCRLEIRLGDLESDLMGVRNKSAEWIHTKSPYHYVGP